MVLINPIIHDNLYNTCYNDLSNFSAWAHISVLTLIHLLSQFKSLIVVFL